MSEYALPTLNINQPIITNMSQIMASLLKFAIWNPGWTSSQIEDSLVSMRKLRAEHMDDVNEFARMLQIKLDMAVKRYRSDWKASVSCYQTGVDTVNLTIKIADSMNVPVISMDDVIVRDGEILLKSDLKEIREDENR